ncbi:MAG: hypothetical protein Q8L89_02625 [Gammaproteobacteria bacterium]|nr:hypothetical protein [Gammaproteobacteria bacterium]
MLLVNTLGLMPGTLSVDLAGDTLHLHVLDERLPISTEVQALRRCDCTHVQGGSMTGLEGPIAVFLLANLVVALLAATRGAMTT